MATIKNDLRPRYTGQALVYYPQLPETHERELFRALGNEDAPIPQERIELPKGRRLARVPLVHSDVDVTPAISNFGFDDDGTPAVYERERYLYLFRPAYENDQELEGPRAEITWALEKTNAGQSKTSGKGKKIAILDTGLDFTHHDFKSRISPTNRRRVRTFVGDPVQDVVGHGTHCAGVACGPRKPELGPRYGVAPDAKLMIGKVLRDGPDPQGFDWALLQGMIWAASNKADIISCSLGKPLDDDCEPHSLIFELVAQLLLDEFHCIIVAASGNSSWRPDNELLPIHHPANCPSIVSVAAVDQNLRVAPFSCGSRCKQLDPDVSAPGVSIRSAIPRNAQPRNPYRALDGTSEAAPCAAGIAALWAEKRKARGRDLQDLLTKNIETLSDPSDAVGAGLVLAPQ